MKSAAYNKVKITWSKEPGATGYAVLRKSGKSWKRIANVTGTSYVHASSSKYPVKTGTTYIYTIKAYRKVGSATYWGTYNNTGIKGKAVPNKPVLVSAVCSEAGKITITLKKASGASCYLIYRKDSNGKWKQIAKTGSTRLSYTHVTSDSWVMIGGTYYDPEAHYAGWYRNVYGNGSYDINHSIQRIVGF